MRLPRRDSLRDPQTQDMNTYCMNLRRLCWAGAIVVIAVLSASAATPTKKEKTFDVFQIGTQFYTNATVTPSASHIVVMHAGGMETLKVANLPLSVKEELGYAIPKPKTNAVAGWTKAQVAKLNQQDVGQIGRDLEAQILPVLKNPRSLNPAVLAGVAGGMLIIYVFFSYCALLICRKTGNPPGVLIWIPIVQLFPLIRAAGMAPIWFVAWLVPVLNIVAQVLWAFKIARARNKGAMVGVLLLFPLTSAFTFMYLAFSGGTTTTKEAKPKAPEIMTLEAA